MFYYGKETYRYYMFNSCVKTGNYIWFTTLHVNALFNLNINTKETKLVVWLPGEPDAWDYYGVAEIYNDDLLILVPHNADRICLFSIKEGFIKEVAYLSDKMSERGCFNLFSSSCLLGNMVYMFPGRYPEVLKIDLMSSSLSTYNIYDSIPSVKYDDCIYLWESMLNKNGFVLTCSQSSDIICFSDGLITTKHINDEDTEGYSGLAEIGDDLFLGHKRKGFITVCNGVKNRSLDLRKFDSFCDNGIKYIFSYGKRLFVIPMFGKDMIEYDVEADKLSVAYGLNTKRTKVYDSLQVELGNNILCCKQVSDKEVLLFSALDLKIILLNLDTKECEVFNAEINDDVMTIIDNRIKKDIISYEYNREALSYWIKGLNGVDGRKTI